MGKRKAFRGEKRQKGMLNFGKYAAIVAAGVGLAAFAAPQAQAACFMQVPCAHVSMGGWGHSYGMYRPALAYHRVTTYHPVLAYHPVTTYRPVLAYHPVTTYRPAYGYAYRHSYGAAYGYAPRYHIRPLALRIYRPATYAWAAPRIHVIHHVIRPIAAYGYVPHRIHAAYGCGC
jgi:hypothetical protein